MEERDTRIVLVHDHDNRRIETLLERGGRIVGWRDGCFRVLVRATDDAGRTENSMFDAIARRLNATA